MDNPNHVLTPYGAYPHSPPQVCKVGHIPLIGALTPDDATACYNIPSYDNKGCGNVLRSAEHCKKPLKVGCATAHMQFVRL